MNYDVIVIGSGPGGYVTAIRASQLGFKTAIIEKENLGGVCLNWGCIPTKSLLRSAQILNYIKNAQEYGLNPIINISFNFSNIIKRSREISKKMNNGVKLLMKKNEINTIFGTAKLRPGNRIIVSNNKNEKYNEYQANHIIIATGARSKKLKNLPEDSKKIIGYKEIISLSKQPKKLIIIGSGSIGIEFAYFYSSIGTKVTLLELHPRILPLEDFEISYYLEKSLKKNGVNILTNCLIQNINNFENGVKVFINIKKEKKILHLEADLILSAIGIQGNIENLGLEEIGIKTKNGKIIVDDFYKTNINGYYAIGDVISTKSLAHVASAEGITCIEKIKGKKIEKIDYNNIPSCTYSTPEIASVGYTEEEAKKAGYEIKIGKFPFFANGKALTNGNIDGFAKVIFDKKYGEWLGCHLIGKGVSEIITEVVIARKLETTAEEILKSIHPHPTLSEAIIEAIANAYSSSIHI